MPHKRGKSNWWIRVVSIGGWIWARRIVAGNTNSLSGYAGIAAFVQKYARCGSDVRFR